MLLFWPKRLRNLTSDTLRLTGRAAEILSAVEYSMTPSSMTFHLIFLYYLMLTKRSFGVNIVAVVLIALCTQNLSKSQKLVAPSYVGSRVNV